MAVRQLRQAAPDARLLVLLRDPVARFTSGLNHAAQRLGGITPDLVADAIARGRYASQLERVLATVDRSQVLVLQFEQCRNETQQMADRTFAFLGLEPMRLAGNERAGTNASSVRTELPAALLDELVTGYADEVRRLQQLLPGVVDVELWPRFAGL